MNTGDLLYTIVGPLGTPLFHPSGRYQGRTLLVRRRGTAPFIHRQMDARRGACDAIVGARNEELFFFADERCAPPVPIYTRCRHAATDRKGLGDGNRSW